MANYIGEEDNGYSMLLTLLSYSNNSNTNQKYIYLKIYKCIIDNFLIIYLNMY